MYVLINSYSYWIGCKVSTHQKMYINLWILKVSEVIELLILGYRNKNGLT